MDLPPRPHESQPRHTAMLFWGVEGGLEGCAGKTGEV